MRLLKRKHAQETSSMLAETPSLSRLLLAWIDQPRATLAAVLARPRLKWLPVLIICLLAMGLFWGLTAQLQSQAMQKQQAQVLQSMESQLQDLTASQREQMQRQMTLFTGPFAVGVLGGAGGLVGMVMTWLLGAAILYFGFNIGGQPWNYGALFSAFSWTWLPMAARTLVNAAWYLVTGQVMANSGLSYFVATGDPLADSRNPWWQLAGQIDLFWLWHLVLVYALVKAARPHRSALGLTAVYLVVILVLRLAPAVAAARLGG